MKLEAPPTSVCNFLLFSSANDKCGENGWKSPHHCLRHTPQTAVNILWRSPQVDRNRYFPFRRLIDLRNCTYERHGAVRKRSDLFFFPFLFFSPPPPKGNKVVKRLADTFRSVASHQRKCISRLYCWNNNHYHVPSSFQQRTWTTGISSHMLYCHVGFFFIYIYINPDAGKTFLPTRRQVGRFRLMNLRFLFLKNATSLTNRMFQQGAKPRRLTSGHVTVSSCLIPFSETAPGVQVSSPPSCHTRSLNAAISQSHWHPMAQNFSQLIAFVFLLSLFKKV